MLRNYFLEFYALLATLFSLRGRQIRQRWAQGYAPMNVTALTTLFICLLKLKFLDFVF